MSSPVLFGPNNISKNLQNGELFNNGTLINANGPKNYITYNNFENGATTGWSLVSPAISSLVPITTNTAGSPFVSGVYVFTITSGNATVGATYTNNSQTFTVLATVSGSTVVRATGTGNPLSSGTLTKATGTGDATLTFSTYRLTTANANLAISAVTSGKLAGNYSLQFNQSTGASVAGDSLISDAVTIDIEDQAKVLTFKAYYSATANSANINFSGTSSNTLAIWIYDVTNGAWIQPAGVYGMAQGSGVGYVTGTFQTTSNSTQYQLAIININASAGIYTMLFDDFSVGPQTAPIGPVVTDTISYTPTFTNVTGTPTGKWLRIGDSMWITAKCALTGGVSGSVTVSLPSGYTIDTTKLTSSSANDNLPNSSGNALVAGTFQTPLAIVYGSTTTIKLRVYQQRSTDDIETDDISSTMPATWASGDTMEISVRLPISGWSSNVQMSNDTDTRVVAAQIGLTSAVTPATNAVIKYDTVVSDTHGAFSVSTGLYTAPVSGQYRVSVVGITGTTANIYIKVNGTAQGALFVAVAGTTASGSLTYPLNAGDTIGIYPDTGGTFNAKSGSVGYLNRFSIERLSGPSVVAATESINARYYASATSISGSLATISWTTKDYDSHNAMSSGTYTVPISGKFEVNAALLITGTISLNNTLIMEVQKNGSVVSRNTIYLPASVTDGKVIIADVINCLAGDTLRIQVSTSAVGPSIVSSNFDNYFSIFRVGN